MLRETSVISVTNNGQHLEATNNDLYASYTDIVTRKHTTIGRMYSTRAIATDCSSSGSKFCRLFSLTFHTVFC